VIRGLLDDGIKFFIVGVLLLILLLLLSGVVGCTVNGIDDCTEAEERGREGDDIIDFELCVFRGNVKEDNDRGE